MSDRLELAGESMEARLGEIADEFTDRINRGERPDVEDYARRYPEMASLLRQVLPALQVMGSCPALGESFQAAGDVALSGLLGDFRLIREVGRGGMGVVYEAEQISLRRRVALKVLPFAATMDPKHLQRFHNEAQAAACLHHTNIVPVFSVGCERGVHFYAMQFIDGQALSELIGQLGRLEKKAAAGEEQTVAHQPSPGEAASTPPVAALTPLTGEGRRSRNYFRKVAELGVQAAEALDHAHQLGIVHRDIKPANLLLDGRGNLWVTDFGLAQVQHSEASLTSTGQMVGTPRYMSPEQALAKRVAIDHRTDVYSLGVTLYEMLTLRPAFASEDRQELLRQIALEEPPRPRRLERSIPMELEIIVLKAMEKRPQDRYATAQALADDLRHWLEDRPIRARRPSWVQVARKWTRRHRLAVRAASLLLCVLMLVGAVNALWWFKKQTAAETEARAALHEAVRWQQQKRWSEALSAVRSAQGALRGFGSDAALQQQVEELGKDLEMAQRLEKARLQSAEVKGRGFDAAGCIAAYREAFDWYGLDVEHGDADAAANFIRSRSIHMQLVAALDFWLSFSPRSAERQEQIHHLLSVAKAADPDEWRNRVRDAWERQDGKAMNDLLASADVDKLLPTTMSLLGISVDKSENVYSEQAVVLLRRAQQRHPDDFWINHDLAMLLAQSQTRQSQEAIGFFRVAVALRPQSPGVHMNLGNVLDENGQVDGAIAEYHEAIRLKPDYADAHYSLGCALKIKGQFDEAIAEYREAIRLKKDFAEAHNSLAGALRNKGRPDEAIGEYREVIRIGTNFSEASNAHYNLGNILREKGQLDQAIAEYREAVRLNKDYPEAHTNLGLSLIDKGRLDEAIDEYRQAIVSRRNFPEAYKAHHNLGLALIDKGRLDEAIAEFRLAIPLKKDYADAHYGLGNALKFKGQLDEAIAEYREAIRLKKDSFLAHNNLGTALGMKGQIDEAVAEFRETIRLKSDDALAHFNLGCVLEAKGQPDKAIEEYREAIRHKKGFAEAHVNLGSILAAKGQLDEAIAAFREAILHKKDIAEAHNNLGSALHEKGQPDAAIAEFREAIRLKKNYAQAHDNLKDALALKETLSKLGAVLGGKAKADNPAEQLALASVCQKPFKRLYAAAAKFYSDAFAAQPCLADDLSVQHRYNAACSAALAGCGQGADADKLDTRERAHLRQQALDWLRADLKAYRQVLEKSEGKAGPAIAQRMQHWFQDGDFAGVRGDEALAKLPNEERSAWRKLWADVAELLAKAQGKKPAEKKPDTKKEAARLHGRVARQPWYAVEIGIVAGDPRQTVGLHEGHGQSIVGEQSVLLANDCGRAEKGRSDGQDRDPRLENGFHRRAELSQGLQSGWLLAQSFFHLAGRPAGQGQGLGDHQLMGNFAKHMGGSEAEKILVLKPPDQLPARCSEGWVRTEMVDQDVGIDKNRIAGRQVGENHGDSSGRNSGSRAIRSRVSASPVQPMMP